MAFLRACAQSFAGLWACFKIFKICVSQFRGRGGAQFASRLGRVFWNFKICQILKAQILIKIFKNKILNQWCLMKSEKFDELVACFSRLPGVGKKSAQKYAYFVALGDPFWVEI